MSDTGWHSEERPAAQQPMKAALRLSFTFDGDRVDLTRVDQLNKLIPRMPGPMPEEGKHAGSWIQLRDADDRVLFTKRLHDPLGTKVEVHDPEKGPKVAFRPPGQGTFSVLVPDLPGVTSAVLFASPPPKPRKPLKPAVQVGRFDLRERPRPGYEPSGGAA